jgi:ATPase family protein associated with various cellular activities (AAA)
MSASSTVHDIKTLVQSFHPVIVVETSEEDRVVSLFRAVADQVAATFFEWSLTRGLVRPPDSSPVVGTTDPFVLLRHLEALTVRGLFLLKDFSPHLNEPKVIRQFRETSQAFIPKRSTIVLAGPAVQLPRELDTEAVRYQLQLPDSAELERAIRHVLQSLGKPTAVLTQLPPPDRDALFRALRGMTLNQARQAISHAMLKDGKLTAAGIPDILDRKAQMIREGGLLEYYPAADNQFELGGFANLKSWLERASLGFTAQAQALNLQAPRGILLVGVPGCGKSLAAKVIAREWKLPLLKLDAGRLYDKYIGESEKNFRSAVAVAESMAPVVLWIDEIEKGLVSGGGDADAGLSRRLFGAFLTWLQEKRQDVFVVATANDLSVLPPELLRKGRFDEIFFVDLPNEEERKAILTIHLRLRKQQSAQIDVSAIASACEGFSGSEIEQAVVASLYRALHLKRPLTADLVLEEIRQTVPLSLSRREDITRLREFAQGRFVNVR